jgi:2-polyprenyl-6-methoxyphenol hydroxylase-like FAD-dependent oxidoreductase
VDALIAPLRTDLDPILVDAAREAGADVRHHVKLVGLVRSTSGAVTGVELADRDGRRARVDTPIVIGADGKQSEVARLLDAPVYRSGRHWARVVYGHFAGIDANRYHWYFRPGASAGIIPSSSGKCCVFVSAPAGDADLLGDAATGFFRVLKRAAPDFFDRVAGSLPLRGFRTFPGQPSFMRQSAGDGWALVGDAGYFKDPCTAHGMTDALVDAELLARAVVEGTRRSLDRYQSTRDALSTGLFDVTDAIASFDWDLPLLQSYHRVLSEEMGRKMDEVVGFDDAAFRAA